MGLFSPVWRLCPFVPRDVLVLVFWWGRSQGEGFYTVEGDGVFPGPVGQDVYARVSRYGAQVHVARDGGGRQRLAQGRGAWGGAGQVMVLTPGVVAAVRGDVYGEGSDGALEFVELDVVEARHRPCVGAPFADPHGVCPRRSWVQLPPCPHNTFHPVPTPQTPLSIAPMPSKRVQSNANTSNPLFNCPHALKTYFT